MVAVALVSKPKTYVRGRQSDDFLKLSHDRKVSPRGIYQASRDRWIATVPNSFGLPSITSCPGRTPFCDSCYAGNAEQSAGVRELVEHNLAMLTEAGTMEGMAFLLDEMVSRYAREADRVHLAPADRIFRIHWDGDFFSEDYARAWAQVICAHPEVRFWAYTRSFVPPVDVVPILAGIDNLELYLSADEWNIAAAEQQRALHGVHLALCGVDYSSARQMGGDRPVVCPENAGKMALMENGRGACVECRICPDGRRDVIFSTSHREDIDTPKPRRKMSDLRFAGAEEPLDLDRVAAPKPSSSRSELEVAADTIAALIAAGVIRDRIGIISDAAGAAGLMVGDVVAARERYRKRGFLAPRRSATDVPVDAPSDPSGRKAWNKLPEGDTRVCYRCKLPKDIKEFQQRTDSNSRRTWCNDCRKTYQRRRYLNVETSEKLGTILRFLVKAGDPCVGDTCPRCHEPFKPGEEVQTDEVILVHHARCPS